MPSVPGAGNTWVRLLIEKGSALRTGSVFGDGFIKRMGMAVCYINLHSPCDSGHIRPIPWRTNETDCVPQGEGKRDTSVIMIKMHYPILGQDMKDAGRIFWLVRHPLSNIISQAKWHITGSHTKVVTQEEFNNYLKLGTFRYHLKMWCAPWQRQVLSVCSSRSRRPYIGQLLCLTRANVWMQGDAYKRMDRPHEGKGYISRAHGRLQGGLHQRTYAQILPATRACFFTPCQLND